MKLSHTDSLVGTPLREAAEIIIEAGLSAIDTAEAIRRRAHFDGKIFTVDNISFPLGSGKLVIVGAGKCSGDALNALSVLFGSRLTAGFAIDTTVRAASNNVYVAVGDHPYPTGRNVDETKKLLSLVSNMTENDTVIFIVSGGGTVLLAQPPQGFDVEDETELIKALFAEGVAIHDMNVVRKHLSYARGGFLVQKAAPAQSLSLIFSDVPGNDLSSISSGPTLRDTTTIDDARAILACYGEKDIFAKTSRVFIETPKDENVFTRAKHVLFMSNQVALDAMSKAAIAKGFTPTIMTDELQGDARNVGQKIAGDIANAPSRSCFLYGGETTVHVEGHGSGGRNRHLALCALPMIHDDCLIASFASDGVDNGIRAGAIADAGILKTARDKGMDPWVYIRDNNSHDFFETVGGVLMSGPTGSNVADLVVALKM